MKLPAMIICHKIFCIKKTFFECTFSKSLLCSHIFITRLGDVIFLALKYDVFRNGELLLVEE